MSKINQLQFEARVLTDPRTKQFPSGKQVTDWLVGLYAGKNQDGTYKRASITVKYWGNTIPQKGKDIVMQKEQQISYLTPRFVLITNP